MNSPFEKDQLFKGSAMGTLTPVGWMPSGHYSHELQSIGEIQDGEEPLLILEDFSDPYGSQTLGVQGQ